MLEYRSNPFKNISNLSKHSFSLNTDKLLNKNLNFAPTPKQYSQKATWYRHQKLLPSFKTPFPLQIYQWNTNEEQEAMRDLAKQKDIIITTTDKGGAVVIMDTENYINEANRRLSDENNYSTLQTDLTIQHNKMLNDALNGFKNKNLLSRKTTQGMKVINQKTPTFYITPRIL